MRNILAITGISLITLFTGCMPCLEGEGEVIEEERVLPLFDELEIETEMNVFLHQDTKHEQSKAIIKGQSNLIPNVILDVSGDQLTVDVDRCMNTAKTMELHLFFPMLTKIDVKSSANVYSEERMKTNNLEINVRGSGDVDVDVRVESLETTINGSGDVTLRGKADEHEIEINGSGDILSFELSTKETDIEINGSGNCEVHASQALDIKINGSGDVKYSGNPEHLNQRINGSGEVQTFK